jgi:hypothetical protein
VRERAVNAGIFVLGAARSGTSAATRVVNLLGVPIAPDEELKPPDDENPRGYFESRALTSLNRQLLVEIGGAPYGSAPQFPAGWMQDPRLEPLRREAPELMQRVHPTTPWVWKDPRTCLTLPFWIDVLDVDPIVVLVYRDPLAVAESCVQRDDAPIPVTLGIWERYNRAAILNADGLPAYVVSYERLVETPRPIATEIASFLRRQGLEVADPGPELEAFVEPALHRSRPRIAASNLPSPEQRELVAILDELQGAHEALPARELAAETDWVDGLLEAARKTGMLDLLRERRKAARDLERNTARRHIMGIELRVVRGSPAWRVLSPLRRLFGLVGRRRARSRAEQAHAEQ